MIDAAVVLTTQGAFFGAMVKIATWIRQCDEHWFARVFAGHRDIAIHNARLHPDVALSDNDALMLTGGGDISPSFLRQPIDTPSLIVDTDLARDQWEFGAVREILASGKPLLAICRGLQVLNVALNGTLHLDIPDHDFPENDNIQKLRHSSSAVHRFDAVNSTHHQALDKIGDGFEIEAWSTPDGIIEQARLREYRYAMAVQYHPERHPMYRPLFEEFFDSVRRLAR
jgi:putative glutamine amidotransferase